MEFSAIVIEARREWAIRGGNAAPFNRIVREALENPAYFWLKENLGMHFRSGASERYGYRPRSPKYQQHKIYAPVVRVWQRGSRGRYVANPNYRRSPQPFVYSGALRDHVQDRAKNGQTRPRSFATGNTQRVEIRVGYPHPVRPEDAGQITKVIPSEREVLLARFKNELRRRLAAARTTREMRTLAA